MWRTALQMRRPNLCRAFWHTTSGRPNGARTPGMCILLAADPADPFVLGLTVDPDDDNLIFCRKINAPPSPPSPSSPPSPPPSPPSSPPSAPPPSPRARAGASSTGQASRDSGRPATPG